MSVGNQRDEQTDSQARNFFNVVGLVLGALAIWAWQKAGHGSRPVECSKNEKTPTGAADEDDGLVPFGPWRRRFAKGAAGFLALLALVLAGVGGWLMVIAVQGAIDAAGSTDGVRDYSVLAAAIALATVQLAISVAHDYRRSIWVVLNVFASAFALAALVVGIVNLDDADAGFDANAWSIGLTVAALALILIVFVADAAGHAENVWLWDFKPKWRLAARPSKRQLRKRREAEEAATKSASQSP